MRKEVTKKKQADGTDSWIVKEYETVREKKKVLIKSWTDDRGFLHDEYEFVKKDGDFVYQDIEVCTKAEVVFVDPNGKKN